MNDKIEKIKNILRQYFEVDDNGNPNAVFDDSFTATEAIDEIHTIVGEI